MKRIISVLAITAALLVVLFATFTETVSAYYVNGYYKSNGTYVNGYYRSRPNAYTFDNYSYTGPSYSNGYGYNNSYNNYSSDWYTPSYYDDNWYYEDSWSDYNSGRASYYDW